MVTDDDRTAWAIPYTDLTMLLLVFFVIMVSQAAPSDTGTTKGEHPGRWITEPRIFQQPPTAARLDPLEAAAAAWARRLDRLETEVAAFLDRRGLDREIRLIRTDSTVRLRMPGRVLFASGSAGLEPSGRRLIDRLAPLLTEIDGTVRVAGHTDDVPIDTHRFPSNWELSAARAIAVVRHLRGHGVEERKMEAVGYGANRPIAENATEAGRAENRRVTVAITPRLPGTDGR